MLSNAIPKPPRCWNISSHKVEFTTPTLVSANGRSEVSPVEQKKNRDIHMETIFPYLRLHTIPVHLIYNCITFEDF